MNHYYINRCIGDIIYALPAIQARGGGVIHTGIPLAQFHALAPLIESQGMRLLHESEGLPAGFINLESFREQDDVYKTHLCKLFARVLEVDVDFRHGWLHTGVPVRGNHAVLNITHRYRDKVFKWHKEVEFLRANSSNIIFLGTFREYAQFRDIYGRNAADYVRTEDFLQVASLISSARYFSGTQSACLAIAEGLGRTYRYERSPFADNVRMGIARETILNNHTHKIHFALSSLQGIWRNTRS